MANDALLRALDGARDVRDAARLRGIAMTAEAWSRRTPLHATASALVVHPASGRVLLRWHERQRAWIQVGGHADAGEDDPWRIALREASEETGLRDLAAWPPGCARPVQVVVVPVPASASEPAHEHADIRYLLSTQRPDDAVPESDGAPLRWLSIDDAMRTSDEPNVHELLRRARETL